MEMNAVVGERSQQDDLDDAFASLLFESQDALPSLQTCPQPQMLPPPQPLQQPAEAQQSNLPKQTRKRQRNTSVSMEASPHALNEEETTHGKAKRAVRQKKWFDENDFAGYFWKGRRATGPKKKVAKVEKVEKEPSLSAKVVEEEEGEEEPLADEEVSPKKPESLPPTIDKVSESSSASSSDSIASESETSASSTETSNLESEQESDSVVESLDENSPQTRSPGSRGVRGRGRGTRRAGRPRGSRASNLTRDAENDNEAKTPTLRKPRGRGRGGGRGSRGPRGRGGRGMPDVVSKLQEAANRAAEQFTFAPAVRPFSIPEIRTLLPKTGQSKFENITSNFAESLAEISLAFQEKRVLELSSSNNFSSTSKPLRTASASPGPIQSPSLSEDSMEPPLGPTQISTVDSQNPPNIESIEGESIMEARLPWTIRAVRGVLRRLARGEAVTQEEIKCLTDPLSASQSSLDSLASSSDAERVWNTLVRFTDVKVEVNIDDPMNFGEDDWEKLPNNDSRALTLEAALAADARLVAAPDLLYARAVAEPAFVKLEPSASSELPQLMSITKANMLANEYGVSLEEIRSLSMLVAKDLFAQNSQVAPSSKQKETTSFSQRIKARRRIEDRFLSIIRRAVAVPASLLLGSGTRQAFNALIDMAAPLVADGHVRFEEALDGEWLVDKHSPAQAISRAKFLVRKLYLGVQDVRQVAFRVPSPQRLSLPSGTVAGFPRLTDDLMERKCRRALILIECGILPDPELELKLFMGMEVENALIALTALEHAGWAVLHPILDRLSVMNFKPKTIWEFLRRYRVNPLAWAAGFGPLSVWESSLVLSAREAVGVPIPATTSKQKKQKVGKKQEKVEEEEEEDLPCWSDVPELLEALLDRADSWALRGLNNLEGRWEVFVGPQDSKLLGDLWKETRGKLSMTRKGIR